MNFGPASSSRRREKGVLVYPVYSRRSMGLSVGINLFPEKKVCSFDCPYCEVFPFNPAQGFSLSLMEEDLVETLAEVKEKGVEVKDICFSGNGEPTISPHFAQALEAAFRIRDKEVPDAQMLLITNGSGLLNEKIFDLLSEAALKEKGLHIWLKLDAGTPDWYRLMNRFSIPFEQLVEKIRAFVKTAPLSLQTMVCAINGNPPSPDEAQAWEDLVTELAQSAKEIREVQIYGKARSAPEDPLASALATAYLDERAAALRAALAGVGKGVRVRVY